MDLKYREVAEILRNSIKKGKYPLDSKIPSEAELSKELKVSRPTIKSAIEVLVSEGLLVCTPSVGSFVRKKPGARGIIGYLAPDLLDPYHAEMISTLEKLTGNDGMGLTVAASGQTADDEKSGVERLIKNGADGILASKSVNMAYQKSSYKAPLVWCGGIPADNLHDRVTIDNEKGILMLVEHLMELNVKRIGYAEAEDRPAYSSERALLLKKILSGKGLPVKEEWFAFSRKKGDAGGAELFNALMKAGLPDAVICYNDWTAAGIVEEALAKKINIPAKLKIAGFDNINLSKYFKVPLTTVDYRITEIAEKSLELLKRRMEGEKGSKETLIIEPDLLVRDSTRKSR